MRSLPRALIALLLAAAAQSQDSSSTSSSSDSQPSVRVVTVGKALHKFVPNEIVANKGDIISFQFFPPNHSVVRAEFGQPCIPYEYTGENKVGFNSGFYPLDKVLSNPPSWNLTINDTNPIFFYCAAPGSCNNWTMVGAINPNDTSPLSIQRTNAGQARFALAPGEPFPSEGEASAAKGGDSPSGDHGSTDTASTSTPGSSSPSSHGNALSGGAIAGIIVAVVFVVGILAAMFFLLGRQRSMIQLLTRPRSKEAGLPSMSNQPGAPSVTHAGYFQPYPGAQIDPALVDAGFVAAPPYKRVSPVPGHRGPHELPSPGGTNYTAPTTGNPFGDHAGHPAFRTSNSFRRDNLPHSPQHEHSRTLSSTASNVGLHRGNGSKSSAILGITSHGSTSSPPPNMRSYGSQRSRNDGSSRERGRERDASRDAGRGDGAGGHLGVGGGRDGRVSPDVSVMAPSPLSSPKPQSRDGPPQLRPLSWWGKKGQKGDSSRGGSSHSHSNNGGGGGGGGFGSSWGKIMIGLEKAYK